MKNGGTLRTALFALAVLLLLAAPALAASDGVTSYRALLIGNSDYAERKGYSSIDLTSCAYDLSAMKSALASGTVRFKKLSARSNLTASGISAAVNEVGTWGMDDDDVTVFYYTGHGESSGLVGTGLNSSGTGYQGYSFSQLQSVLSNVPGKVIVLLDSCQSGGLINKSMASEDNFTDNAIAAFSGASSGGPSAKAITSGSKFHVIASSSKSQYSYAKTNLYGLTTWALCEAMGWSHNGADAGNGLESLEGDGNGDLTVTVGEAYSYAAQAVSAELERYGYTQDMKAYPENSGLMLISRAAVPPAPIETPKAVYRPGVLNFSKACIAPGKKLQLTLNVEGATQVHWSTSNSSIAKVDENTGLVTGVKYSYSVVPRILVNYYVGSNSFYAYCDFRVLPARYVVQSVILNATKPLENGLSYTMPVKILPSSAWYKSLRWSSSDETVATVHPTSGKIKAVADSGTAVITATALSGATGTVTVTAIPAQPRSVSLNYKARTLIPGQSFMLTQTVLPASVRDEDKSVKWKSKVESVATVDDTGMVTANKDGVYGTTVISATTKNGRVAYCTVNVVRNQSIPRTSPKSAYGKLTSSARRIYYNTTGSLVIDMYFSNRTRYTQKVPMYTKGIVLLKLKSGSRIPAIVTVTDARSLGSGRWTLYTFKLNLEDYPNLSDLDLRGSDARYEAQN